MSVVGMQHSEVVAAIKAGGDETSLLVVDREAEAFFNRCNVIPTGAHLTGTHTHYILGKTLVGQISVNHLVID